MSPPTVDARARKQYAELLRHFAAGLITNREFEKRLPYWREIELREVDLVLWPHYDDPDEYKLVGDRRLSSEDREYAARLILFLRSGLVYRWPRETGLAQLPALLLSLLTLGWFGRLWFRYRAPDGDQSVWPFYTRAEYEEALRNPPYLRGTRVV
jgi:hypothetical protein